MDRRAFLGTMTAAILFSRRLSWAGADSKIGPIGLQLYTVRSEMAKDFEGTLAKVASIGYREVEFAGYFDHSPKDVRAILDRHGLTAPSTHVDYDQLGDKFPEIIETAKIVGHEYIVNPDIDESMWRQIDGWKRAAGTFNRAGEASKRVGIQFAYHNHWWEFSPIDGKLPYDILLENTDPNLVKMEMDLCWIMVAGQDPVKYFNRYSGRFPLVHVKDIKKIPPAPPSDPSKIDDSVGLTEVGSGDINWERIFAESKRAGIKHYFVEQDVAKDPFESIRISYEHLEKLRF